MSLGTILSWIIGGFLLLVVLFLPLITRSSTPPKPDNDDEREKAYRRGLMIGAMLEEIREIEHNEQNQPRNH